MLNFCIFGWRLGFCLLLIWLCLKFLGWRVGFFFLWGILGGMWLYLVGGKDKFCLRDLSGLKESFGFLRFRVLLGCFLLKELLWFLRLKLLFGFFLLKELFFFLLKESFFFFIKWIVIFKVFRARIMCYYMFFFVFWGRRFFMISRISLVIFGVFLIISWVTLFFGVFRIFFVIGGRISGILSIFFWILVKVWVFSFICGVVWGNFVLVGWSVMLVFRDRVYGIRDIFFFLWGIVLS